jgi:hypothetical protein
MIKIDRTDVCHSHAPGSPCLYDNGCWVCDCIQAVIDCGQAGAEFAPWETDADVERNCVSMLRQVIAMSTRRCHDCGAAYHGDVCPGCGYGEAHVIDREMAEEGW